MARPRRVYSKAFVPASMRQKFLDLLSNGAAALSSAPVAPVTLAGFRDAYRQKFGEDLLHSKYGFESIRAMLSSLPSLIKLVGKSLKCS